MKLDLAANRNIFLLVFLCLTVMMIIAVTLADRDMALHKSYYERYEAANILFKEDMNFDETYDVFKELAEIYKDSYVLELKMAVCAIRMGMWAEAVEHSRLALKMYPLLAGDYDFMDAFSYSLKELGETEAAARIMDHYQYIAAPQIR